MADVFNPYHLWLGIPVQDQPPHYYRLLGLTLFEADSDVISSAADARIRYLSTFRSGPYGEWAERLLKEIEAARLCLLNPEKKAQYDAQLRTQLAWAARSVSPPVPPCPYPPGPVGHSPHMAMRPPVASPSPPPLVPSPQPAIPSKSISSATYLSRKRNWENVLLAIVLLALGVTVVTVILVSLGQEEDSPQAAQQPKRSGQSQEKAKVSIGKDVSEPPTADSGLPSKIFPQPPSTPDRKKDKPPFFPKTRIPEKISEQSPPEKSGPGDFRPEFHQPSGKPLSPKPLVREWKDRTGKELGQGRFGELRGKQVDLVDSGGKYFQALLEDLCEEDQKYIDEILETRGYILLLLLSAVPVTKTIERSSLVATGIPLDENREIQFLSVIRRKYEITEQVPVTPTLEQLKAGISYLLRGKTLRLKANIHKLDSGTIEFDIFEEVKAFGASQFWNPTFRTSVTPPKSFIDGLHLQIGDQIYFQGEFDLTIEACPKCGGTGSLKCPDCLNGFKQKTVLQKHRTPDGKVFYFPGRVKIPCGTCMGTRKIPCDHYIRPQPWNPASSSDKTRWIIGQLRFSRAELLQSANIDPKQLFQIRYALAMDAAYALCFHLKEMEVGVFSQGKKKVIIRPDKSD